MITIITNVIDFYDLLDDNTIIIIYVFAEWSSSCKKINNHYLELSNNIRYKDICFLKVNTSYASNIFIYPISIPSFIIFKNKVKINEYNGYNENDLESFLNKYI
jgi:thiol-disulfide isomerase/thioredoxin